MKAMRKIREAAMGRYLELVKQFPLMPIADETHYDAAVAFLKKIAIRSERDLSAGERAYLDALTLFVEDFQNKHHAIYTRQFTALEALSYLMEQSAMSPADLGRVIGSRSLASQILQGRRELSKSNIVALARHFKISAAIFLPVSGSTSHN